MEKEKNTKKDTKKKSNNKKPFERNKGSKKRQDKNKNNSQNKKRQNKRKENNDNKLDNNKSNNHKSHSSYKNKNSNNNSNNHHNHNNNDGKSAYRPTTENVEKPIVRIDDHPRAVVLCFDQKAIEDIAPRKYTSGYEIYRIPISLARNLHSDEFLENLTSISGIEFKDKQFLILRKDELVKLKPFCQGKKKNRKLDKDLRTFYSHLEYFINYVERYNTAVAFDF